MEPRRQKRKKVILFYNPHSGNGLFKNNLDLIIARLQKSGMIAIPVRAAHGQVLNQIFSEIDQSEYEMVIAAGGDGTINICVNAMINNGIELPLAIMPAGTANDFAYYFDLPSDINEMMDIILGGKYTYADVGKVNERYFINVAAMGMLVDVSQKTDPNLKNTLGILSYYLRGLTEVTSLRPIPIKLTSEEFTGEENMFFMLVMNGRSAGGFKRISPHSEVNDGLLDVMLFKEMPVIDFAPLLINVLQGNHQENKNVIYFKTAELTLESPVDVSTDIDGEKGEPFPLHFTVLPKKLKIATRYDDMKGPIW